MDEPTSALTEKEVDALFKIIEKLKSDNVAIVYISHRLEEIMPYEDNEKAFVKQLDFLEAVGASRVNVCELTGCLFAEETSMFGGNKPVATDAQWEELCEGLNKLGKIATNRGFKLCYHHHMATIVQTFNETKRLLDSTDPRYVYLCYDTGHFAFSKEDPVKAAREFGSRIGHE